jgi:hypothetical protein
VIAVQQNGPWGFGPLPVHRSTHTSDDSVTQPYAMAANIITERTEELAKTSPFQQLNGLLYLTSLLTEWKAKAPSF